MRLFQPRLSKKISLLEPILTSPKSKSLHSIYILPDLSQMHVTCTQTKYKVMVKNILFMGFEKLPITPGFQQKNKTIYMNNLCDVALELIRITAQLRKEDPLFLHKWTLYQIAQKELREDLEDLESLEDLEKLAILEKMGDVFMFTSPLRSYYTWLHTMRQTNIQHTVELSLKSLLKRNILNRESFNDITEQVWLKTNLIRAQKKTEMETLPTSEQYTPCQLSW